MRALEPDVFDAVWAAVEPLLPAPTKTHPLGCHRRRIPDRTCFRAMLLRLVTGCSWVDAEQLVDGEVSNTTLRSRRDEWERAGVFDRLVDEAIGAYDKIIGLDLTDAALDGSQHKAPGGGEGTGRNRLTGETGLEVVDPDGPSGHSDRLGDQRCQPPRQRPFHPDTALGAGTRPARRHRDAPPRPWLRQRRGQGHVSCIRAQRRDLRTSNDGTTNGAKATTSPRTYRPRWPVERTNSWLSNFGQLRRSTDRSPRIGSRRWHSQSRCC